MLELAVIIALCASSAAPTICHASDTCDKCSRNRIHFGESAISDKHLLPFRHYDNSHWVLYHSID